RPVMLATIREFSPAGGGPTSVDGDDFRSAAIIGVITAIQAWDEERNPRLAGVVRGYVADEVAKAGVTTTAVSAPFTTLKRFFSIVRKAGYDLEAGIALAPEYDMAADTFRALWESHRAESLDYRLGNY